MSLSQLLTAAAAPTFGGERGSFVMRPIVEMLSTLTTTWMIFAISCTALPFLHAVPWLQAGGTFGDFGPFFAALIVGLAAGVPLSIAARRLCNVGPPTNNVWAILTRGSAAFFGIVGWGLPVGLAFTLDEFLRTKNLFVVLPNAIIWPVAGLAFGLAMRWLALRREPKGAA
jgi:hypothetical protein